MNLTFKYESAADAEKMNSYVQFIQQQYPTASEKKQIKRIRQFAKQMGWTELTQEPDITELGWRQLS